MLSLTACSPRNIPPEVVALSVLLVGYTNMPQTRFGKVSRLKKKKKITSGLAFSVKQIIQMGQQEGEKRSCLQTQND